MGELKRYKHGARNGVMTPDPDGPFVRYEEAAAALEAAREDSRILANARTHLPTRVETESLGDYTPEECAAFDSGYNLALDRAHNLLNRRPGAIAAIDQARGKGVGDEA